MAVLGVSGAGYALVNHYDGNIDRLPGVFGGDGSRPAATERGAQNFLIVGSDSRGDLEAGEGVQGKGDDFVTGQRADTVILAHLYGGRSNQAQLVSFPRDSYVEIPSHVNTEDGTIVPAQMGKLNRSFYLGGPKLLIDTIENLSDVRIDHYLQIDFDGFKGMVDQLGGIDVCLPKAAKEKDSGIDLPAGRSHVQGDQALAFVRQRKKLPNGDLDRIGRQQQFMGAVIRKVLSAGTLLNPLRLNGFLDVATSSLQVDEDLEVGDLRDLALRFRSFSAGGVSFATVPVESINGTRKNADGFNESVVLLDDAKVEAFFQSMRDDVPPGQPDPARSASPAPALIVAPGAVRVEVFNGAGVAGLGRKAATELRDVGFSVIGTPGNRGTGATQTLVLHGPDKADSAATLAAAIPGAVTQLDPTLDRTLQVVVGSDYTAARPVTVAGATRRPTTPTASADAEGPDRRGGPLRTLGDLTGGLAGPRDPAAPLLTLYDGDARVELSGATTANWVAKSANLLVDGLGGPRRVGLLLPLHWQTVALLLAAVATGAEVVVGSAEGCDAVFASVDRLEQAQRRRRRPRPVRPPARRALRPAACAGAGLRPGGPDPRRPLRGPPARGRRRAARRRRAPRPDGRRPAAHRPAPRRRRRARRAARRAARRSLPRAGRRRRRPPRVAAAERVTATAGTDVAGVPRLV